MNLQKLKILIAGQLKTSRTETLEDYLRDRTNSLGVIGFMSPFASYDESRCTLYEKGIKKREFSLPSYRVKKASGLRQSFICFSFLVYIYSFFKSFRKLGQKFDVFIGIATFSTMLGLILKKLGKVDKVIYYCLDYYPPSKKLNFNRIINIIFRSIDKLVVRSVDAVWHISPRIKWAREHYTGLSANSYSEVIVPLGYTKGISYDLPLEDRERWSLGFVGTLSENQGLQMVIGAMPELIKEFPEVKVRIIGHGPYTDQLKGMAKGKGLGEHFIFHGFVRDDAQAYSILSRCMAGLATWTGDESDNSLYADPGKPKLYALLGLPTIITSAPYVSELISETGAGEVIDYCANDFISAVKKIIAKEEDFRNYQEGIEKFRPFCLAENIFNKAFSETEALWGDKQRRSNNGA
ncbi:MAG: glycosyltransferase [Candidatus Omnitrophota bacterium]